MYSIETQTKTFPVGGEEYIRKYWEAGPYTLVMEDNITYVHWFVRQEIQSLPEISEKELHESGAPVFGVSWSAGELDEAERAQVYAGQIAVAGAVAEEFSKIAEEQMNEMSDTWSERWTTE